VVLKNTIAREGKQSGIWSKNCKQNSQNSAAESIEGSTLPLKGIDNVHGSHSLPASMLRVGNSISDDILEEDLEHAARFFVDEAADPLHAASASEAADGRLGDTLDVITEDLAMALGAAFPEAFAALAASRHGDGEARAAETL
jgi:hypothetical protein